MHFGQFFRCAQNAGVTRIRQNHLQGRSKHIPRQHGASRPCEDFIAHRALIFSSMRMAFSTALTAYLA